MLAGHLIWLHSASFAALNGPANRQQPRAQCMQAVLPTRMHSNHLRMHTARHTNNQSRQTNTHADGTCAGAAITLSNHTQHRLCRLAQLRMAGLTASVNGSGFATTTHTQLSLPGAVAVADTAPSSFTAAVPTLPCLVGQQLSRAPNCCCLL